MPKVSVLLTTYNRPQFLQKAINSVLAQTYRDYELIILDDNSDDRDQIKILDEFSFYHADEGYVVRSNVQKNQRKLTARYATMVNHGLRLAKGEYIAYLCDDDYFEPEKLQYMIHHLESNPQISVVYGKQRIVELKDGVEIPYAGQFREAKEIKKNASCQVDHSSVMMRKNLVDKVGFWDDDPNYWGSADSVYWDKLNKAGFDFYPIDILTDTHVYHDGSWTKDGNWQTKL